MTRLALAAALAVLSMAGPANAWPTAWCSEHAMMTFTIIDWNVPLDAASNLRRTIASLDGTTTGYPFEPVQLIKPEKTQFIMCHGELYLPCTGEQLDKYYPPSSFSRSAG